MSRLNKHRKDLIKADLQDRVPQQCRRNATLPSSAQKLLLECLRLYLQLFYKSLDSLNLSTINNVPVSSATICKIRQYNASTLEQAKLTHLVHLDGFRLADAVTAIYRLLFNLTLPLLQR